VTELESVARPDPEDRRWFIGLGRSVPVELHLDGEALSGVEVENGNVFVTSGCDDGVGGVGESKQDRTEW
jgi:hypothetical protein